MAVESRRSRYQQARGRLYGISGDAADGGAMSRSGRGVENIHRSASVVYDGDGGGGDGGGFGSWCGCISGGSSPDMVRSNAAKARERSSAGHGGDIGAKLVKSLSGGFVRSSTSPGKVSPLVEVVPPLDANDPDKCKASPTLLEMMTHDQELQSAKPGHSIISLSQQPTFQEKIKSFHSGIACRAHNLHSQVDMRNFT
jgi:hypothetical protein